MKRLISGGIRFKLLMLVIGVALPLAYVGWTSIRAMWDSNRRQLDDSVKQQAELAAVAFKQWIDAQREPLTTIALYLGDQPSLMRSFQNTLRFIVDTRSHWAGVRVVSAQGEVLMQEPPDAPPLSPAALDNALASINQRPWVIESDWTQGSARGLLIIATPIEGGGAVIAQVEVTTISEFFFNEVELSDKGTLAVYGPERRVLLYRNPTPETHLGRDMSDSPFFAHLSDQRASVMEVQSPIDGVRRVYGLATAGETGCVVTIGIPSEALYTPARQQFNLYIAFSLVALLAAIAAALFIARSIAIPVRNLSSAARRFGAGDYAARAPDKSAGELGELSASFNAMAAKIKEREARLAELDRLKSDFVSGVSHEMRTPLTTIKTLTRVLLRSNLSDTEKREYLETIAAECDRQIDLVLNLLDLSRIEAGTFNVALARVDVGRVVEACIAIERHSAEARKHRLEAGVPDDLPPVLGDRAALRRVLCGIVENAIKYMPDGGRVRITAYSEHDEVAIAISDSGPGILAEDLPHVFEKFYRGRQVAPVLSGAGVGEAVESNEAPGVGLGLYLARTVIEEIGGRITAESKLGLGSTFTIHLPVWRDELDGEREDRV
ncbi:MAG TPA: ATP-binding protein [Blastocatellia bacterium]|jgi:signal transduction histidine kinase